MRGLVPTPTALHARVQDAWKLPRAPQFSSSTSHHILRPYPGDAAATTGGHVRFQLSPPSVLVSRQPGAASNLDTYDSPSHHPPRPCPGGAHEDGRTAVSLPTPTTIRTRVQGGGLDLLDVLEPLPTPTTFRARVQLARSDWQLGCPLATVALEASASSEAVRQTCAQHFAGWEASIAARLAASGVDRDVAHRMAMFALATIEGALMLARVERSARPLEVVGDGLRALVGLVRAGSAPV